MNDRVRIYELGRSMGVDVRDIITGCRELGMDVKSHSSTIDKNQVGLLIAHLGKKKQAVLQADTKSTASAKAGTGTPAAKTTGKAAPPPPAPPVKPRVLARYRRPDPAAEVAVEPVVEQAAAPPTAPDVAPQPTVSPAVAAQQAAAEQLAKLNAAREQAAAQQSAQAKAAKVAQQEEPAESETHTNNDEPPVLIAEAPARPRLEPVTAQVPVGEALADEAQDLDVQDSSPNAPIVSKAVLEQQRQLQEIARSQEASRLKQVEREQQVAATKAAVEREAQEKKSAAEANKARRFDRDGKPHDPNKKDEGSSQIRDAFSGTTRPSPSAPAQPIRIAAPSFRATPPRAPKPHHRAPAERHPQSGGGKGGRGAPAEKEVRPAAVVIEVPKVVAITGSLTVKELAERMNQPDTEIIKRLFMKGVMRTVNQLVEAESARDLAVDMGYELASQEDIQIAAAIAAEEAAPKVVP